MEFIVCVETRLAGKTLELQQVAILERPGGFELDLKRLLLTDSSGTVQLRLNIPAVAFGKRHQVLRI